jgi:hypothetical protein
MLDPGTYAATLDRFEETPTGELAVLIVEREGEPVSQLDLPVAVVPAAGRHVDAVFEVVVADDRFAVAYRPEETDRRAESAAARFDRLARRPPSATDGDEDGGDDSADPRGPDDSGRVDEG